MSTMPDQTRNLNPHKPAIAAMFLWGERYSEQRGGAMDFWYALSPAEKRQARYMVKAIQQARDEEPR